ncbi:helix-turn-helix domain-containing protein [bacterium]|nr:helix-turn-helix domain-containing protein [bacterium]
MEIKTPVNKTNSYTTIQDYFLAHWVNTIGLGPAMLYIQLLSYCHKGKDISWPSIQTLNKRMGTTTKTLIRYRNTLMKYGLIKKVIKQKSSSGGYDHNLYQIVLLNKENILYPPVEKLPEEKEEIISGIAEKFSFQDNPKKVIIDNKKFLKTERIKEELEKLNLDKKSIDKIISNYSLEDIEKKIDLLRIKKNVVNPAGWLIAALKANYLNPESSKEENYEEEKIMETEEIESESKIVKLNKLALKKKEKEEKDRLFMEESLKWIEQNLVQRFEM